MSGLHLRRRHAYLVFALAAAACGQTTAPSLDAGTASGGELSSQAGAQRTDSGRPADSSAPAQPGSTGSTSPDPCTRPNLPGVRVCCGKPGEMPGANCLLPAFVDTPCSMEGEVQDIKRNAVCCAGLTPISTIEPADDADAGSCTTQVLVDPTRLCTHCGDGRCGTAENRCNCPADCK